MTPRCPATNNHHPFDFPWSITARCSLPADHPDRLHRARMDGVLFLWPTDKE